MKTKYILLLIIFGTMSIIGVYASMGSGSSAGDLQSGVTTSKPDSPTAENVSSQYNEEVKQLETYLQTNPDDTTHLRQLARLYQDGHNSASAALYYERLLKLNPGDRQSWLDLANCYATSNEWSKAKESVLAMLDLFPDDEKGRYNLGAIYANTGEIEKAKELWSMLTEAENAEVAQLSNESLQRLNNSSNVTDENP